jgi:hypothetical protein
MTAKEKARELYPDWKPVSKKVDSLGVIVVIAERQAFLKGYEYAKQQPEVDYQKMFANCSLPNEKQPEQDKVREAAEKVCCDNQEMTDQRVEVSLNDKDGTYIDVNVDFCKNCGTCKDVWQYG